MSIREWMYLHKLPMSPCRQFDLVQFFPLPGQIRVEILYLPVHQGRRRHVPCARNIHLYIPVYPAHLDVLHQQGMDVFDDLFIQGHPLPDTFLHIAERLVVIDRLIDLPQNLTPNGDPVLQEHLCLDQGQGIPLYGCGIMGIFYFKCLLEREQRIIRDGSPALYVQFLFPKQLLVIHKKPSLSFKTFSYSIAYFSSTVIRIFPFKGNYPA